MTKSKNVLSVCISVLATLVFLTAANQKSFADDGQRKFTTGEVVDTGGGMSVKILQCRGAGDAEECEVQYYRGDDLESTPRWENASFIRTAEARVLEFKKRERGENAAPQTVEPARPDVEPAPDGENKTADLGECDFTKPDTDTSPAAKPSEQLFKAKIYRIYGVLADGTGMAPLRVGVTFESFQMGRAFTNVVKVDPGRGAYRVNDAAPVNAAIYPVVSKHIVCEQYRDGIQRRRVENKYACFKNRDGEWVCGADGIPKTTQLN
jgi:hypothetical protein